MRSNPLEFVQSADIGPAPARHEGLEAASGLNLDKLPDGVVSSNTLIDFSATPVEMRSGLSLAMTFASRAASTAMRSGDDEDDWFAAYKTNLMRLGFTVSQGAFTKSTFKKKGLEVHKAIIPFLTIALGGAGVGPVLLGLLENLQNVNEGQPWITLFDREARKFETREMHFGAVSADASESRMRHVVARLSFIDRRTNVLFFKITDASAEFESTTTTISINNNLLAAVEPRLRERLEGSVFDFIKDATI